MIGPRDRLGSAGTPLGETLLSLTESWHPELRRIIERSDLSGVASLPVRNGRPEVQWPSGPVTLLGDAIHAMSPAGGVGANTALKDARALADALAEAGALGRDAVRAIAAYESAMRAWAIDAVAVSDRGAARLFALSVPAAETSTLEDTLVLREQPSDAAGSGAAHAEWRQNLTLHDIAALPLVHASEQEKEPGTAEQWQWEMETLIGRGEAFVIIFPPDLYHEDAPQTAEQKKIAQEGRKHRARWLKENRRALAAVCKGLITIQENGVKRVIETAKSAMLEKAFGVPFKVTASVPDAEKLGRQLFGASETQDLSQGIQGGISAA